VDLSAELFELRQVQLDFFGDKLAFHKDGNLGAGVSNCAHEISSRFKRMDQQGVYSTTTFDPASTSLRQT
jgi:hypothetical protein